MGNQLEISYDQDDFDSRENWKNYQGGRYGIVRLYLDGLYIGVWEGWRKNWRSDWAKLKRFEVPRKSKFYGIDCQEPSWEPFGQELVRASIKRIRDGRTN